MFGFGKHGPDKRYGAVIDIGSGSIGVAVVVSDSNHEKPEIIWSHRERMVVRDIKSLNETAKNITVTLLNSMLILGSEGIRALKKFDKTAELGVMQVSISAPWSYTIIKTVSYSDEHPFLITKKLIKDLKKTAQDEALHVIDENDLVKRLGLEVIVLATMDITANGYSVENPTGQESRKVTVSHVSAITQKRILDSVHEAKDKILPKAVLENYSFMLIFYCVLDRLYPDTNEICLIDITSEATEIGIVRDGNLKYCTHAPFGSSSIAREISEYCKIPKEESLQYMRGDIETFKKTLSESKQQGISAIFEAYEDKITELFKRTGDSLSIPKPLFIHTDKDTEPFFKERIQNAAYAATGSKHGVHLVTSKLLEKEEENDTAILLSTYFFHNMHSCDKFEQT